MAIYNTGSDSANTNVRAFLTTIGEHYYGARFDTSSGVGKQTWKEIQEKFNNSCAYCNSKVQKLTIEHLIMFNRTECGLHHPGNIVPCCKECNKRSRNKDKQYVDWETHLRSLCSQDKFNQRKEKIKKHMEEYGYPNLSSDEFHALKAITHHLYESTKNELDKSVNLFKSIDANIVNKS